MKKFLWTEDRCAGYAFWKFYFEDSDIIVQSKGNNVELKEALKNVMNDGNKYFVLFDKSFNNRHVMKMYDDLVEIISKCDNIILADLICFEEILLRFPYLVDWVLGTGPHNDFINKLLRLRLILIDTIDAQMDPNLVPEIGTYAKMNKCSNVEQVIGKLLNEITRYGGFLVKKGKLGECWISSCCNVNKESHWKCGLSNNPLSRTEKLRIIREECKIKLEGN